MLHSILAVLAGYAVTVVIVIVGTMLALRFILGKPFAEMKSMGAGPMPAAYLTANLVISGMAALAGGCLTASMADDFPLKHGLALAVLMVAMGLVSMRQAKGSQPRWYQVVLITVMPAIAVLGAWLWTLHAAAG